MARRQQAQAKAPIPSIPAFREDPTEVKKDILEWMRRYDTYIQCVEDQTGDQTDQYKKGTLQLLLGQEGLKDYARNPDYQNRDNMNYADFRQSVINHFRKRPSKTKARVDFGKRVQEPGETVHDFVHALRRIAEECQFVDLDDALQTQLLAGTSDQRAQTELMAKVDTPALDDIIKILQASETASEDLKKLRGTTPQVAVVRGRGGPGRFTRGAGRGNMRGRGGQSSTNWQSGCDGCGATQHRTRDPQCPALGKTCARCGRMNHFARKCRTTTGGGFRGQGRGRNGGRGTERINRGRNNATVQSDSSDEANGCRANDVRPGLQRDRQPTLIKEMFHVRVQPRMYIPIQMLVDTGANTSILSEDTWRKELGAIPLKKTHASPTGANGRTLKGCLGTLTTKIAYGGRCQQGKLYVFAGRGIDTIGTNFLRALRAVVDLDNMKVRAAAAITKTDIRKDFAKLCGADMGTYKGSPHRIQIQPGTTPTTVKLRPIPMRMFEAVKQEIRKMDSLGVWEPVQKSEWVHPLVAVPKKDGGVRITTDLTRLNEAVIPDRFPIPRIKDIIQELSSCSTFSKLDLKKGYFHIPLHPDSRGLTTTITPLGLRQYRRLPMGLKDSTSAFQQRLQETLQRIPGVRVYIDDIIVGGRNQVEHDDRLRQVLSKLQTEGYRLQLEKLTIGQAEVPAFGYILSAEGIKPDPKNIEAIKEAPPPNNLKELQRFLGMVNYFQEFLRDSTTVLEPLRKITRQEEEYIWGPQQEMAFRTIKKMLERTSQLKPYNPKLETIVTVDASDVGLGAVLSQKRRGIEWPCAFWNKTLDTTQRNYSASEKEALACVLACEHWEDMLLGTTFILRTDHQALTTIFTTSKSRRQSSKFARWKERLAEFSYKIEYLPGPHNSVADYLSRLEKKAAEHGVRIREQIAGIRMAWIEQEASIDPEYKRLKETMEEKDWKDSNPALRPYKSLRTEIQVVDDIITVGGRIVPPKTCCKDILLEAHRGHPGMVKTKQFLRRTYFWPRMNNQVEQMINACEQCQSSTKSRRPGGNQQVAEIPRPAVPGTQWGLDITGPFPNGQYIIAMIDYTSRYPEICITKDITTGTIREWLQQLWDRHGLPEAIVTDNGPQFTAREFEEFLKEADVHHYLTAVYNPRENGLIERFNGYLKAGMETFRGGNWKKQVEQLIVAYRRMPVDGERTAMDIFYGRKIRTAAEPNRTKPMRRSVQQRPCENPLGIQLQTPLEKEKKEYTGWSTFRVGQQVMTKKPQVPKGSSPWQGPKTVVEVLGAFTYRLSDQKIWNLRKMKKWTQGSENHEGRSERG